MSVNPKVEVTSLCSPAASLFPTSQRQCWCWARSFHFAYHTTRLGCGIKATRFFLPKALVYYPQATSLRKQNLHAPIVMSASPKTMRHCGMVAPAVPLAAPIWNTDSEDPMTSTVSFVLATLLLYHGSMRIWWHLSGWSSLPSPTYLSTKDQIQIHERAWVWAQKKQIDYHMFSPASLPNPKLNQNALWLARFRTLLRTPRRGTCI